MSEFRIVKPPGAFTTTKHGEERAPAFEVAAAWLAEQCGTDWEPLRVAARGNDARVVLSGGEHDELVILRRVANGKARSK